MVTLNDPSPNLVQGPFPQATRGQISSLLSHLSLNPRPQMIQRLGVLVLLATVGMSSSSRSLFRRLF
jgi:hypothetical protein